MSYVGNKPAQTTIPADDAVTTAMLKDDAVTSAKINDGTITSTDMAVDPRNASNLNAGDVPLAQLDNVDTSGIVANQDDIALLGFKVAANGSLAKYNLVDQTIDAFEDTSGVDASASTDEIRNASNYYSGVSPGVSTAYSYTGSTASLAVVAGPTYTVKTWGAGGGDGQQGEGSYHEGAGGGFSTGTYSFGGATTLIIAVGGLGTKGNTGSTGGWPGGGNRGAFTGSNQGGANGAGYSGVFIASQAHANSLQIAGGGGGGYYYDPHGGSDAGGGGSSSGTDAGASGSGGDQSSGGTGTGGAGSALQGGTGGNGSDGIGGAGGGGGYYGGAGSGGYGSGGDSGGGGSGFVATTATINSIAVTAESTGATTATVGVTMNGTGSSDSNYPGGGIGDEQNNGAVYISATESYNNMTLVSNATTAVDGAPTTGDLVITYTDGAGTATVNTDIKAYISRNGSAYTSAVTLVSQGTTGGHTILTANGVDLSGITTGTSMRWKVETLNQAVGKQTRIQAVSLGWS